MNQIYFIIQAILPFLIIPASLILFRWKRFRNERVYIYLLILFSAFLFDLSGISFRIDLFDILLHFAVIAILCQIIWSLFRLKKKTIALVVSSIVFSSYIVLNIFWLMTAPVAISRMTPHKIDSYNSGDTVYTLSKRLPRELGLDSAYVFILNRTIPASPFEKRIDEYITPEGYFASVYRFHWRNTAQGVRLNLIADKDTLWTLGDVPQ